MLIVPSHIIRHIEDYTKSDLNNIGDRRLVRLSRHVVPSYRFLASIEKRRRSHSRVVHLLEEMGLNTLFDCIIAQPH